MPTFASIQEEIRTMLDVPDKDLNEEERQRMDAYLDELASMEAAKVDAFAAFIKEQAARADYLKAEAKRIAARASTIERKIDRIKEHYLHVMQSAGLQRVAGATYTLTARISTRVCVQNVSSLPDEYCVKKTEITADKKAIAAAIKSGKTFANAWLVEGISLQIR